MNKILQMSAAKVFNLTTTLPIILFFVSIVISAANRDNQIIREGIFIIVPIAFIFSLCSWMWVVGVTLNQYVAEEIRPKVKVFKVIFVLFIVLIIIYYSRVIPIIQIYPLMNLLGLGSGIYCIYFISKNLEMAERKTEVSFKDIRKTMFDVWILPSGIWRIQPRINALYSSQTTHNKANQ